MIDISTETVLSPAEARNRLPARRAGKRPDIATIYRWMQIGCRGIRLEFIVIGGTRCTSLEALQRFFDRLTEAAEPSAPAIPPPALTKTRQRQIEAAERRLAPRHSSARSAGHLTEREKGR
jgi:Protein of unknown function (DUF1580)